MASSIRSAILLGVLFALAGVTLVSGRQLLEEPLKNTDWQALGYKTTKPTIGIVSQRCHNCPGR